MMLSVQGGENINKDSSDVKLLNEIDAIRKALYLGIKTSKNSGSSTYFRSQSVGEPHLLETKSNLKSFTEEKGQKEKKSLWSKTLMAFSHIRNRKFDCCFTLQVHSIEGLPPVFNDVSLCVYWKRREKALVTQPAKVYKRTAEFEEELIYTCSVYGNRSGLHHSAKYEAKHFLLYASIYGEPELDLGKHRVDLTRLLPLTLEELEQEKSSGKWTTSYKLSGIGKGARLNISFGYSVISNSSSRLGNQQNRSQHDRNVGKVEMKFGKSDSERLIRRTENLPSESRYQSVDLSRSVEDIKDLLEVLPVSLQELAVSMDVLSKKLDEDKMVTSADYTSEHDALVEHVDPIKPKLFPLCDHENDNCVEFQVSEQGVGVSSNEQFEEDDVKSIKLDCKDKLGVSESSLGSDDDIVTTEFLRMLGIEHSSLSLTSESESDSPRERLLRKFEKEDLADGCSLLNYEIFGGDQAGLDSFGASNSGWDSLDDDFDLTSAVLAAKEEHRMESMSENSKTNSSCGFRSPVHIPQNAPIKLAVIGNGLNPNLLTKNGGFLNSKKPSVYKYAKSGESLIMQVSCPVVLPAEMSPRIMEELQLLASVAFEKLSMQSSNEDCMSRNGSKGESERGKGSIKVTELPNISAEDNGVEPSVGKHESKSELNEKEACEEKATLQFRITEVHIAGVKSKPCKKVWGLSHQPKSGSRWLVSNGMGKINKHPLMKSKAPAKSTSSETVKAQPGD